MMSLISTPHFGLNFLSIAKEYCNNTNTKNRLEQSIKIIIFSAVAAEAIVNMELKDHFNGKELEKIIKYGPPNDKRKISPILKKWELVMKKQNFTKKEKDTHIKNLDSLINLRNELIHFKPHKNQTEKILAEKKYKVVGIDGQLYTTFKKTGFRIIKKGIINELTLTKARKNYDNLDSMIFNFYKLKKTWPNPSFSNLHWGKKSPFYKYKN
ncbi:MAG: hypothetical protein PHQ18_05330 [Patescibacteria group bacterium]|nr:hypothetical protein [Patescibacteria group bacterium]